jgi:hypothetical protein
VSTRIWLTDEDSDIAGYKRAKVGSKSDCISLVRSQTLTQYGPATIPITRRNAGSSVFGSGVVLQWITDPLGGPSLTDSEWEFHAWAWVDGTANTSIQLDIIRFHSVEADIVLTTISPVLDTGLKDIAYTTGLATATTFTYGDRLVIKLSITGSSMVSGHTVTLSYNGLFRRAEGDTYVETPDEILLPDDIPDENVNTVRSLLRDSGLENPQLVDLDVKKYIKMAINTYSIDRPLVVSSYMTGDGQSFDYPLPGKWVWGYSTVQGVEYPADQQLPSYYTPIDYEVREGSLGPQPIKFLRFKIATPSATDRAWLQYTTRHHHSTEYTSIVQEDLEAVMWMACYFACVALASGSAATTESTLNADVVNHRDGSIRWRELAETFKKMYIDRVVSPDSATPVGFTEDWDSFLSSGMPYLWHGRRARRLY